MKRAAQIAVALLIFTALASAQSGKKGAAVSAPAPDESKIERHYWLLKNGGAIEMVCKAPCDAATQTAIQTYLDSLSRAFEKGAFDAEYVTGNTAPETLATLKRLRDEVTFHAAASSDFGYSLRMLTINQQARDAIHDFVRYEITNRKTGDPTTLE